MKRTFTQVLYFMCLSFGLPVSASAAGLTVSFSVSDTVGCIPLSVKFTNNSSGARSCHWDFGNGNTSSVCNPGNVYTASGIYTVKLVATDSLGNKDSVIKTSLIRVVASPLAAFSCKDTMVCPGVSIAVTNSSLNAASYIWDFGDGNTSTSSSPSHSYNTSGSYTLKLIAKNAYGCNSVVSRSDYVTVYKQPTPSFTANVTESCDTSNVFSFTDKTSSAISRVWNFGDGDTSDSKTPDHKYAAPGEYTVRLIAINLYGCKGVTTVAKYITVDSLVPPAFAAAAKSGCEPFTAYLKTSVAAKTYSWDFGDGSTSSLQFPKHIYTTAGTYDVKLSIVNSKGCTAGNVKSSFINVVAKPVASFSVKNPKGCKYTSIQFTNNSSNAIKYSWDFGDGSGSTAKSPVHSYIAAGVYTVSLTAVNSTGCSAIDTIINAVTILSPQANFGVSATSGCNPLAVNFSDSSLSASSWHWDFGNGDTSGSRNPVYKYTGLGTFDVTLVASNSYGCRDTMKKSGYISVVNLASGYTTPSPLKVCAPYSATFTDPTKGSVSWAWDFGDGTTSTDTMPVHIYKTLGIYKTSLTTIKASGCKQTINLYQTLMIKGGVAAFTDSSSTCPPYVTKFTDSSNNAKYWFWNFGDGYTSNIKNPYHVFSKAGYHSVSLTITTNDGCSNTYLQSNAVYFKAFSADFAFKALDTTFPQRVQFNTNTVGATGYLWDFGDTTTSTTQNPLHKYKYKEDYSVKLTVTNPTCSLVVGGIVYNVTKPPVIVGTPTGGKKGGGSGGGKHAPVTQLFACAPASVDFKDTTTNASSWHWDFGDSTTYATTANPTHRYTKPGKYDVTLIVKTGSGKVDTVVYKNYIFVSASTARFNISQANTCRQSVVSVRDSSINAQNWIWDFGDGDSSYSQNTSHTYAANGKTYTLNLTVTDSFGCASNFSKTVYAGISNPASVNKYSSCFSDSLKFSTSLRNYKSYDWNFGDSSHSASADPKHRFSSAGNYTVRLTATDTGGCVRTYTIPSVIVIDRPDVDFTGDTTKGCTSLTVNFDNATHGIHNWYWDFGDGNNSYRRYPVHTYSKPGLYTVSMSAENNGCKASVTKTHYIRIEKPVSGFTFTQSNYCFPVTVSFKDSSHRARSWYWNFGDGDTSTSPNPVHIFKAIPSNKVTLNTNDSNGCSANASKIAPDYLSPKFSAKLTQGCAPWNATFTDSSTEAVSWFWSFGDGDTSGAQNPKHVYKNEGKYDVSLVVASADNCRDTLKLGSYISVYQPKADFYSPDKAACAPSYVTFHDTSTEAVSWAWDFGDGSHSYTRNPGHIYNMPGLYTVKLHIKNKIGCEDSIIRVNYIRVLGPVTSFTVQDSIVCGIVNMAFTDISKDAVSWDWNFGDGNTSSDQNPGHTYTGTGKYTVSLITKDSTGCAALYAFPNKISVNPKPTAGFHTIDTMGCAPYTINYKNSSANAASYYWNFGDGFSSTEESPVHTYDSSGNFKIYLVAKNHLGCSDTMHFAKPLHVNPSPRSEFSVNVDRGCSPLSITFTNKFQSNELVKFYWDFGNGQVSTEEDPKMVFSTPGQYNIKLVTQNNYGCTDTNNRKNLIEVFTTNPPVCSHLQYVTVLSDSKTLLKWDTSQVRNFGSYTVYRRDNETGEYERLKIVTDRNQTTFVDGNLNTLQNAYTYKLQTADACGNAFPLDSIQAHTTINVTAIAAKGNVKISWTPYKGASVGRYEIYRTQLGTADTSLVATVGADTTTLLDTTFVCPVTYFYKVKGVGLNGGMFYSWSDTSAAKPENLLYLQKVDITRSTVVNDESVLTEWVAPSVEPGKISGYEIHRSKDNLNFELVATVPKYVLSYMDSTTDVHHIGYFYKIIPINYCDVHGQEGNPGSSVLLNALKDRNAEKILLNWTPYLKWKEGVDHYIIEKQNPDGTWEYFKETNGNTYSAEDQSK